MKKIRVAVVYGGKSGEHEVSLQSGASVIRALDRNRFEVIPVSIDKMGRWQWNDLKLIEAAQSKALPIFAHAPEMRLAPQPDGRASLQPLASGGDVKSLADIDVIFPVVHGPLCEDGTLQGLLELADVAYVGSGVLGSAIGMDKDIAKKLAGLAGVPIAPYIATTRAAHDRDPAAFAARARESLRLPVFVKPCNMGSSVGIHKVKTWEGLAAAITDAFRYDSKILVEQGVDAREVEVAVLDGNPPTTGVVSEITANSQHEFYSYEAKYLDENGAAIEMPAKISALATREVSDLAVRVFQALECAGLSRVDFFLDRSSNKFYFNEINTLPGFTSISMYPKMMEASGLPYKELLTKLIELAMERHALKRGLKRDFS